MISKFGNATSAPDLIKPPCRLPLPGDYLLKAHLISSPALKPIRRIKAFNFSDEFYRCRQLLSQILLQMEAYLAASTKRSVT